MIGSLDYIFGLRIGICGTGMFLSICVDYLVLGDFRGKGWGDRRRRVKGRMYVIFKY